MESFVNISVRKTVCSTFYIRSSRFLTRSTESELHIVPSQTWIILYVPCQIRQKQIKKWPYNGISKRILKFFKPIVNYLVRPWRFWEFCHTVHGKSHKLLSGIGNMTRNRTTKTKWKRILHHKQIQVRIWWKKLK